MLSKIREILNLPKGRRLTVSTDSRNCPQGCVFFALKGENFDGNLYAAKALENGAALAVVDKPEVAVDGCYLLVDDVLRCLQATAAEYRDEFQIPVIGITGSNGKTTTKELISACLGKKFRVHYTQGNLNNSIGVPLTVLSMPEDTEIAVIEMGASHPGDIKELVAVSHPTHGIITNVGRAHMLGFGSFEGVIKTKGELYDYLREHNGRIFINSGNEYLTGIAGNLPCTTYAVDAPAAVTGHVVSCEPFLKISIFDRQGQSEHKGITVETKLVGAYNAENVLAATAIATYFGVDISLCAEAITNYTPTNNRSQMIRTSRNTLIVDAYNANPTSMEVSVSNFNAIKAEHKMLILGQMGELGIYQNEAHRKLIDTVIAAGYKDVLLVGANFKAVNAEFPVFDTTEQLAGHLKNHPVQGYTILIKGSHSNRLDTITELL